MKNDSLDPRQWDYVALYNEAMDTVLTQRQRIAELEAALEMYASQFPKPNIASNALENSRKHEG